MKKALSIILVIALALSLGTVALAAKAEPVDSIRWTDGFGFHCNATKGNGKVVTGAEKAVVDLVNVGGTAYALDTDAEDAIVCPACERIDWVTYSNNNGKISGKNIQVNHSGDPVYLAEASATLTLIDTIVSNCPMVVTGSTVAGTETKNGTFKTSEIAEFEFEIPAGYEIIEGANPVVITFEAVAGQNLSGAVVAEKIIVVECECEDEPGDDEDEDDSFPGTVAVFAYKGNGNNNFLFIDIYDEDGNILATYEGNYLQSEDNGNKGFTRTFDGYTVWINIFNRGPSPSDNGAGSDVNYLDYPLDGESKVTDWPGKE